MKSKMTKRVLICFLIMFFQNVFSQNITEKDSIKYPTPTEILEKYKISNFETIDFTVNTNWKINDIEITLTKLEGAYNELGDLLTKIKDKESRKPYLITKSKINNKIILAKSKISLEKARIAAEKARIAAEKARIAAEKSTIDAEKSKRQAEVSTEIVNALKKAESQKKKEK